MTIYDFKILEKIIGPYKIQNLYYFKPVKGFSIDSRTINSHQAYIALRGLHCDGHDFIKDAVAKGANFVIAQKYVPTDPKVPCYLVEDTYQALQNLCRYIRQQKDPFVCAITGSVGKTTTKEILAFMLEPWQTVHKNTKTENNFLGVAKTILSLADQKIMLLELGTNKCGEIKTLADMCVPDAGIITFIKPAHLEGLGNLRGILQEKLSLYAANRRMKAILNRDDPSLAKTCLSNKIYWFGKDEQNTVFARPLQRLSSKSLFLINNKYSLAMPSLYEHYLSNVLAALTMATVLKIPLAGLVERMNAFHWQLPGRMEAFQRKQARIINDAYNANPYSCIQALRSLKNHPGKKIAVLGDMLELGKKSLYYHRCLAKEVINNKFDYCLTFGSYSDYVRQALQAKGYNQAYHFSSHKDIANFINSVLTKDNQASGQYLIFLKGSRKMELEKIISYL